MQKESYSVSLELNIFSIRNFSKRVFQKRFGGHSKEIRTKNKQNRENRETKLARVGKEHSRKIGLSQVCRRVSAAGTDSKANWSQPYLIWVLV